MFCDCGKSTSRDLYTWLSGEPLRVDYIMGWRQKCLKVIVEKTRTIKFKPNY